MVKKWHWHQSLYALRVLRHHGLGEVCLQMVFRAVVVSRLTYALYAASAWIVFITGADNQRIEAFLRRSKRCGYCPPDLPDFVQLAGEGDERLFTRINNNQATSCATPVSDDTAVQSVASST